MLKCKKCIAAFLTVILMFCLISCGEKSENSEKDENTNLIVIGFSQPGAESAWRVALTDSVREAFTEERGYKLIYKDGQSKQDNQIRDITPFIQQGVDYIILSPIVETGWDTVLLEAKQANIPVIICDRNVVVSNESLYTAFVGSDFKSEGEKAVAFLEEKYASSEEEINIVHIKGTLDSSAQLGRTGALEKAVLEHDNWNIIAENCGEFTKAKAREIMQNILLEVDASSIDVIYCENDEEALGVMAALNEAGIAYGKDENITIISFDGTRNALEQCLNGKINYVVECNPLQGPYLFNIIEMLSAKKTVPKITYIYENAFEQEDLSEDFIKNRKY